VPGKVFLVPGKVGLTKRAGEFDFLFEFHIKIVYNFK
jgi:hypothetical protein